LKSYNPLIVKFNLNLKIIIELFKKGFLHKVYSTKIFILYLPGLRYKREFSNHYISASHVLYLGQRIDSEKRFKSSKFSANLKFN
jgi:hypothetical protein